VPTSEVSARPRVSSETDCEVLATAVSERRCSRVLAASWREALIAACFFYKSWLAVPRWLTGELLGSKDTGAAPVLRQRLTRLEPPGKAQKNSEQRAGTSSSLAHSRRTTEDHYSVPAFWPLKPWGSSSLLVALYIYCPPSAVALPFCNCCKYFVLRYCPSVS
jgi:hypothetical protein